MKISPKFEVKCDKCGYSAIVEPDREDIAEPRWPDDWIRIVIESNGGGRLALCPTCKKKFWTLIKEES